MTSRISANHSDLQQVKLFLSFLSSSTQKYYSLDLFFSTDSTNMQGGNQFTADDLRSRSSGIRCDGMKMFYTSLSLSRLESTPYHSVDSQVVIVR